MPVYRVCVRGGAGAGAGRVSAAGARAALCELLKYLAYQKLQVPYSYELLRLLVRAVRERPAPAPATHAALWRATSHAYDALETIFKALQQEMSSPQPPTEVCILLGASLVTCKEAYRLILPDGYHSPQCAMDNTKAIHTLSMDVLRTLTTSDIFEQMINKALPLTNIHVLIKKTIDSKNPDPSADPAHFTPSTGCRIPRNSKLAVIRLGQTQSLSCCSDFTIFEDLNGSTKSLKYNDIEEIDDKNMCLIESTESVIWFQCNAVLKGFKDCCVDGSSVTNQWLQS